MNKISNLQRPAGDTLIQLNRVAHNLKHITFEDIIKTEIIHNGDKKTGLILFAETLAELGQILQATTDYFREQQE
jgi:hypothetical protein